MTTFTPAIMDENKFNTFYKNLETLDINKHELEISYQDNGYTLLVQEKPGFWSRLFRSLFGTPETVRVSNVALLYLSFYKEYTNYFSCKENIVDINYKIQSYFHQYSFTIYKTVELSMNLLLHLQLMALENDDTNKKNSSLFEEQKSTKMKLQNIEEKNVALKAQLEKTKNIEEENVALKAQLENTKKIQEENATLKAQLEKTTQELTTLRQNTIVENENQKKEEEQLKIEAENSTYESSSETEGGYGLLDKFPISWRTWLDAP